MKINERLSIHKRLDSKRKDKWIEIIDLLGDYSGPYISHKHNFRKGITYVTFLMKNEWYGEEDYHPNQITTMEFTDEELCNFVSVNYFTPKS